MLAEKKRTIVLQVASDVCLTVCLTVIRAGCMMKLSRHLPVASLMLVVVNPMRHRSFIFVKTTGEERTTACALMSKV